MKIKYTSVYVDDQEKAFEFYTKILGFVKKQDISQGKYRWLTVASPEEPQGTQLQLAPNDNPAANAYQKAIFSQGIPAALFLVSNIQAEYEKLKKLGVRFTMPPTKLPVPSTIAVFDDTCGNLIQIVQLETT